MTSNFTYDILRDCSLLEKDKSFRNLYSLICAHGDIDAATWLEDGIEKSLTFNELAGLADNCAAFFKEQFGSEGRICISLDSCKDWFPIFWGLARSGHDVLTLDASMPDEKASSLMEQTQCIGIISGKRHDLDSKYKQILVKDLENLPTVKGYEPVWGKNIALCTSGTTSDSRIFIYNEETICYLALFSAKVYRDNHLLIDNECFRTLAFLPFHHILGFAAIFIWSHFLGDTTVYLKDRSPMTISRTVKQCRVNQIVAVPLLANSISKTLLAEVRKKGIFSHLLFSLMIDFSCLIQNIAPKAGLNLASSMFRGIQEKVFGTGMKSIVLGGSHTDRKSLKVLNGIGYYTICGYGMTETAITGFETSFNLQNRLKGSIGEPMEHTEYRLRPLENAAAGNSKGEVGELQIRGKGLHDARILNGELLPPDIDADGWFSTGDIARIIKEKGQYFIEGRLKEVIINESGENVYPDELEDSFMHLDGVVQYTIVGLKRKNSRYEDITLVLNVGDKFGDEDYVQSLSRYIRIINKELPVYKKLNRAILSADPLPIANGFKVKRIALKQLLEDRALRTRNLDLSSKKEDIADAAKEQLSAVIGNESRNDELVRSVRKLYSQILSIPEETIDPHANFVEDLGGDSLQILSIITKAEEQFCVMIPAESYSRCATVAGAAELLGELIYGTDKGNGAQQLVRREPVTDFEKSEEYQAFVQRRSALTEEGGRDPYFVVHDSPLLDTSVVDGKTYIDFGSYNYAGMSGRKEINDAAKAAIDKYGTSASGSRLLAGEKPIHGELERAIAEWKNAEAAIVLVGGHSTNVTVVGNFCGKNDLILYDALAHNSIEQGCKLSDAMSKPFPHGDIETLEHILRNQRQFFEKVLIVIEGAYSMDGDVADVPAFVALKKKYGCFLMVDEAHSSCVLGAHGGGVDEYFHLAQDDIDLKYGTLSKGLGTCGGYIAGKKSLVDYFKYNLPGFVFSVGISPGLAAGSLEAIRLLRSNPEIMEHLHRNIDCFVTEAKKRGLDICLAGQSAVVPVLVGKDEDAVALSNALNGKGILVPPALYPAVPKNRARLRFSIISEHKPEQIIHVLDTLVGTAKELNIELPGGIH
ncbi:MAG: aminotransferase class I/II-fold pyridoxal phosphate-dependent enzyme [Bacteroidales bacterium]|nr:aminotransferase class I/II-fold pyridoxal phosphate-dependent enzyme [Bacteroidales bacterium]